MNTTFPLITNQQLHELKESLTFPHVSELRSIAVRLGLSEKGKKMEIIVRILHFLQTGEKLSVAKVPQVSSAQRGKIYPLLPGTLIVKGSYKNDLKTRLFFKSLIGNYFHFTAFGIDWINERWMEGNPPTYQEFADMWKAEYQRRKETPEAPKEEWAYINFVQQFLQHSPNVTRDVLHGEWEAERQKHKKRIEKTLDSLSL